MRLNNLVHLLTTAPKYHPIMRSEGGRNCWSVPPKVRTLQRPCQRWAMVIYSASWFSPISSLAVLEDRKKLPAPYSHHWSETIQTKNVTLWYAYVPFSLLKLSAVLWYYPSSSSYKYYLHNSGAGWSARNFGWKHHRLLQSEGIV
jgi:hypothetical protein